MLLVIFENQEAIATFAPEVDGLQCRVDKLECSEWTTQITIKNMSESLLFAFLNDTIEMSLDYSYVIFDCYGITEYLIKYDGVTCPPNDQMFCDLKFQPAVKPLGSA